MALLEVKDLQVNYGVITALKGISFEVNEGEIVYDGEVEPYDPNTAEEDKEQLPDFSKGFLF